jgi:aerobic C4-dicarboxylate transport protein
LKTIAAPVIFVTVVIGIASLGNLARAGALAVRALGYSSSPPPWPWCSG